MSDTPDESQIEVTDTPELPADSPGVEEGEVLDTTNENLEGELVQERVVFDYVDGEPAGWHKEVEA